MEIYEPLEIANEGKGTGRWRMTVRSTEDTRKPMGLCRCKGGHANPEMARKCADARSAMPPDKDQTFDSPVRRESAD
jgi:hypothetical protein